MTSRCGTAAPRAPRRWWRRAPGWSTLVMTVPTDMVPRAALGRLAGLVGLGGAMGGILMGQAAGWALDAGLGYTPVLVVAALLHVLAFALICWKIPVISQLDLSGKASA